MAKNGILQPTITGPIGFDLGSGIYQFSVTDTNNCEHILEFTLDDPPEIIAEIQNSPIGSDGLEVQISGGLPPYSALWSTNDTSLSINMLTSGLYEVLIIDDEGCETTASYLLTNVDVSDSNEDELLVYPNPTRSAFSIYSTGGFEKNTQFLLLDFTGKIIWSTITKNIGEKLEVREDLPSGVYQLIIHHPNGNIQQRKVLISY